MSDDPVLMTLPRRLPEDEVTYHLAGYDETVSRQMPVRRGNAPIGIAALHALMAEFDVRRTKGDWDDDRAQSDRWLAPGVHFTLRLTRCESSATHAHPRR